MNKEKILIIDDNRDFVKTSVRWLEAEGYDVLRAYTGAEGLRIAAQENPALILLDASMPGMDGFEVLMKIKERKIPTRVIIQTAYKEKKDIVKFMKEGACDYLTKDEDFDSRLNSIRRAIEVEDTIDHHVNKINDGVVETVQGKLKTCFVITPIGSGEMYEEYLHRYENIIKPAVEGIRISGRQVYKSIRADFVSDAGSITRSVIDSLFHSDVVIADLSDLNPNVFYELGVRHALRNQTILIASKGTKPPFDVGDLRIIFYENRIGGEKKAIPELQAMLQGFAEQDEKVDSPVFHALPEIIRHPKKHDAGVYALEIENKDLKAILFFVEHMSHADWQSLPESIKDEIEKLFSSRDHSVASKNIDGFLGTQTGKSEIAGGFAESYFECSKLTTSILQHALVANKSLEGIGSDYAVLVREDYKHNEKQTHSSYIIYHIIKTEDGLKIAALKSVQAESGS